MIDLLPRCGVIVQDGLLKEIVTVSGIGRIVHVASRFHRYDEKFLICHGAIRFREKLNLMGVIFFLRIKTSGR